MITIPGGTGFLNLPRATYAAEAFLTDPFAANGSVTFVTASVLTAKLFYSAGSPTSFQPAGYGYFRQAGGPRVYAKFTLTLGLATGPGSNLFSLDVRRSFGPALYQVASVPVSNGGSFIKLL
jgi:hypothetical protein